MKGKKPSMIGNLLIKDSHRYMNRVFLAVIGLAVLGSCSVMNDTRHKEDKHHVCNRCDKHFDRHECYKWSIDNHFEHIKLMRKHMNDTCFMGDFHLPKYLMD